MYIFVDGIPGNQVADMINESRKTHENNIVNWLELKKLMRLLLIKKEKLQSVVLNINLCKNVWMV